MAHFGTSQVNIKMFILVVAMAVLLQVSVVLAQDSALAPLPDTGDALALPVSGELICFSVLFSLIAVLFQ